LVVASRSDLTGDVENEAGAGVALSISAATGGGLGPLVGRLAELVSLARVEVEPARPPIVVHRPAGEQIAAQRVAPGVFALLGRAAERAVGLSDLTDDQALDVVLAR